MVGLLAEVTYHFTFPSLCQSSPSCHFISDHYTVTLTTIQTRFINNETILPQNVKVTGVFGYSPLVGTWYTKDPPIVVIIFVNIESYRKCRYITVNIL